MAEPAPKKLKMTEFFANSREGQAVAALALSCAAMCESELNIRMLIAGGIPVNARAKTGWTALHVASILGFPKSVKCLLDRGADINARSDRQETPLHFAALHDRVTVAEVLIAYKADLEARDEMGDTPLQVAMAWNFPHMVDLLLKAGAKMSDRGSQERVHTNIMQDVNHLLEHLKLDVEEPL